MSYPSIMDKSDRPQVSIIDWAEMLSTVEALLIIET
jgi:hypothetical protein